MKKILKRIILVVLTFAIILVQSVNVVMAEQSSGITLYDSITVTKGSKWTFRLSSFESGHSRYMWTSDDSSIVKCDDSSKYYTNLEAVGVGTTKVYAYRIDDYYQTGESTVAGLSVINITVVEPSLESISLAYSNVSLSVGESLQNSVSEWEPVDASVGEITWTSSNSNVAKVSSNGLITGVSAGTTTIYASAQSKRASCSVTVKEHDWVFDSMSGESDGEVKTKYICKICNNEKNEYTNNYFGVGSDITWSFKEGVLILSGSGDMTRRFVSKDFPWHDIRADIIEVRVGYGITSVGDFAFNNCINMQSVTLSSTVKSIEPFSFAACEKLTYLQLPDNLTKISWQAFNGSGIEYFELPSSLTFDVLPGLVFSHTSKCKGVYVNEDHPSYSSDAQGVLYNKDKTQLLFYPIGSQLTEYTVPDGVTEISSMAFGAHSTGEPPSHSLKKITLPNTLTKIDSAFWGATALEQVVYNGTKEQFDLIEISESNNENFNNAEKIFTVKEAVNKPMASAVSGQVQKGTIISLSTQTTGATIYYTTDGSTPTTSSKKYTDGIIVDDDTVIKAFATKDGMENSSVATFSYTVFTEYGYNIDNGVLTILGNGDIDDFETTADIPWYAERLNITKIIIEDGIKSIGTKAFYNCINATVAEIPESVTRIGENAFKNCDEISIKGEKGSYAQTYAAENGILFICYSVAEPLSNLNVEFAETSLRWYFDISNETYVKDAVIYIGIYDTNNKILALESADMISNDITSISVKKVDGYSYAKVFEWIDTTPATNCMFISLK